MSRSAHIGITVIVTMVVVCLAACLAGTALFTYGSGKLFERSLVDDSRRARLRAAEIIEYELPPGFSETGVLDFASGSMIFLRGGSGPERAVGILITYLDAGHLADTGDLRRQLQSQVQATLDSRRTTWTLIEARSLPLGGSPVAVYTFDGQTDDGAALRRITTDAFRGKSGLVMITISGPRAGWPAAEIEAFLASLR